MGGVSIFHYNNKIPKAGCWLPQLWHTVMEPTHLGEVKRPEGGKEPALSSERSATHVTTWTMELPLMSL